MIDEARWVGDKWVMFGAPISDDMRIWWWIEKPDGITPMDGAASGESCKTGLSGSGKCGAAAYCDEPVDCCLNCDKACGCRCGWIDDED